MSNKAHEKIIKSMLLSFKENKFPFKFINFS